MQHKKTIAIIYLLALTVAAYTNSTSTDAYQKLVAGDPIHALHQDYEDSWGDWFYLILAGGPFLGLMIYQKEVHLPMIWLTSILAAYGVFLDSGMVPTYIYFLLATYWIMKATMKLLSPIWTN